ncbi:MAG: YdcF family protein, partial [Cyanobacteriota bacterium]
LLWRFGAVSSRKSPLAALHRWGNHLAARGAHEGEVHRQQALALGLPARALAVTPFVRNTAEEARAVAAQLPRGSRVLLVTSAFHMARSKALFARQGLEVVPYPVDFQARGSWAGSVIKDFRYWLPSAEGLEDSSRALREAMGRLAYRI